MQSETRPGDRQVAILVSVAVGIVVAVITIATFWWIYELATGPDRRAAAIAAAAPYDPGLNTQIITKLSPQTWVAGVQAGQTYIQQFPQPQNVQVLTGMSTQQIWAYMVQHVSPALGVPCQYCHDINNFAADTNSKKISARNMLILVGDLNTQFMSNLPDWRGNYVQCATCHNGKSVKMEAVNEQFLKSTPPIPVTVDPLDSNGEAILDAALKPAKIQKPVSLQDATLYYLFNYEVWLPYDAATPETGRGSLALTYEDGRTQDQVTVNQGTMNTMSWSLGVGCTYCHNSRNFISYEPSEVAALLNGQKVSTRLKAVRMLLMTTWLAENWEKYGGSAVTLSDKEAKQVGEEGLLGTDYYRRINGKYYRIPSCYTCHVGRSIPKAALDTAKIPAGDPGIIYFPPPLRGDN